jgi:hypothetical protein
MGLFACAALVFGIAFHANPYVVEAPFSRFRSQSHFRSPIFQKREYIESKWEGLKRILWGREGRLLLSTKNQLVYASPSKGL